MTTIPAKLHYTAQIRIGDLRGLEMSKGKVWEPASRSLLFCVGVVMTVAGLSLRSLRAAGDTGHPDVDPVEASLSLLDDGVTPAAGSYAGSAGADLPLSAAAGCDHPFWGCLGEVGEGGWLYRDRGLSMRDVPLSEVCDFCSLAEDRFAAVHKIVAENGMVWGGDEHELNVSHMENVAKARAAVEEIIRRFYPPVGSDRAPETLYHRPVIVVHDRVAEVFAEEAKAQAPLSAESEPQQQACAETIPKLVKSGRIVAQSERTNTPVTLSRHMADSALAFASGAAFGGGVSCILRIIEQYSMDGRLPWTLNGQEKLALAKQILADIVRQGVNSMVVYNLEKHAGLSRLSASVLVGVCNRLYAEHSGAGVLYSRLVSMVVETLSASFCGISGGHLVAWHLGKDTENGRASRNVGGYLMGTGAMVLGTVAGSLLGRLVSTRVMARMFSTQGSASAPPALEAAA